VSRMGGIQAVSMTTMLHAQVHTEPLRLLPGLQRSFSVHRQHFKTKQTSFLIRHLHRTLREIGVKAYIRYPGYSLGLAQLVKRNLDIYSVSSGVESWRT